MSLATDWVVWLGDTGSRTGSVAQLGRKMAQLNQLALAGLPVPSGFVVTASAHQEFCEQAGLTDLASTLLEQVSGPDDLDGLAEAGAQLRARCASVPVPAEVRLAIASAHQRLIQIADSETAQDGDAPGLAGEQRCLGVPVGEDWCCAERCRSGQGHADWCARDCCLGDRRGEDWCGSYLCMGDEVSLVARSSAVVEDGETLSFAGAFDSFLGLRGIGAVVAAVRDCWASVYQPTALSQILRHGLDPARFPMAVGVVQLIPARSAGVAFSAHPISGDPDLMVVEANWGFGPALMSGRISPDHLEIDCRDLRVLRYDIGSKDVITTWDRLGRIHDLPMPRGLRSRPVLDAAEIQAIAKLVRLVEHHFNTGRFGQSRAVAGQSYPPVDVEWVIRPRRGPGSHPLHHPADSKPLMCSGVRCAEHIVSDGVFGGAGRIEPPEIVLVQARPVTGTERPHTAPPHTVLPHIAPPRAAPPHTAPAKTDQPGVDHPGMDNPDINHPVWDPAEYAVRYAFGGD